LLRDTDETDTDATLGRGGTSYPKPIFGRRLHVRAVAATSCPTWCTEHAERRLWAGGLVHRLTLGAAAGLTVTVSQGPNDVTPRVELLDGRDEVWHIGASDAAELAELLAMAASVGDRPLPEG